MTRLVLSMFCFRFAHLDGTIPGDPAVYARLPKFTGTSPAPKAWTGWS